MNWEERKKATLFCHIISYDEIVSHKSITYILFILELLVKKL